MTDSDGEISQAKKLAEKITKADGIIIVSPEYNHGYLGELKLILDMLHDEHNYKFDESVVIKNNKFEEKAAKFLDELIKLGKALIDLRSIRESHE